jgi:hypothetical protein
MLKKILGVLLGLAMFSSVGEAAPHWLKVVANKTYEYGTYAGPVVMSLLATKGGFDCRHRNGVEPCTAHYGEFRPTEGARFAVSLTFSGLSMYGHKQKFKEWPVPAWGMTAFNAYWWRHEEGIHDPDLKQKK